MQFGLRQSTGVRQGDPSKPRLCVDAPRADSLCADGSRSTGPHSPCRRSARVSVRHRGFTLIEAALTTVIIGTGVLAILAAQQAYHKKNDWAQRTSTALLLANELRERTMSLPQYDPVTGAMTLGPESNEVGILQWDDLDDYAGVVDPTTGIGEGTTFSPPVNALGLPVDNLPGWEQQIRIANVREDNISVSHDLTQPLGTTDMVRVTVLVNYTPPSTRNKVTVTSLTWVVPTNR